MSQAYYRKWRPMGWDEVVGQEQVTRTLRNAVGQGHIAHAYLFSGPRGTGKTTTARIIAKAANCLNEDPHERPCNECENCQAVNQGRFLDLIEIDAASNTSVDDVRDLREKINYSPSIGKFKIYIIDEAHMLSNAAFNALLKTLEEPPAHAIFVLATTEAYKIPATVLSRCQRHEFRRIPLNFIQAHLKEIAEKEAIEIEPAALTAIARQATGSLRDAVSLLDQLASTGAPVTLQLTQQVMGTAASLSVVDLIEALLKADTGGGMAVINQALDGGSDPRQLGRQTVDSLRAILMVKLDNAEGVEATTEEARRFKEFADRFSLAKLLFAINTFDQAAQHTNVGWQPGLQLELALAQSVDYGNETQARDFQKESGHTSQLNARPTARAVKPSSNRVDLKKPPNRDLQQNTTAAKEPLKTQKPGPEKANPETTEEPEVKPTGGLGAVKERWRDIRAKAREISPETAALLNSCRSVEVVKGKVALGFSGPLLCSKMENGRNLDNARAAIKAITGVEPLIECRVAGAHESVRDDESADVEKDGMVGAALSLGGKITKKEKTDQ